MQTTVEYELIAPAKVNLSLIVEPKLIDERHPVETVMQTISLCDSIRVRVTDGSDEPGISIAMNDMTGIDGGCDNLAPEDNLIYKAIIEFEKRVDSPASRRFEIEVDKRIPAGSGMGGGSSDCAAMIALMCELYGLDLHSEAAVQTACALGSDIAFFLDGGCAYMGNFGEKLLGTYDSPKLDIVIARPDSGLSTGSVYRKFDEICASSGKLESPRIQSLINGLRSGYDASILCGNMQNDLNAAARTLDDEVDKMIGELASQKGAMFAMLSGSGSAAFGIFSDESCASEASKALEEAGWWSVCTTSVAFGAGVCNFHTIS